MRLVYSIATSKVSVVCGKMQNFIFIRRVPLTINFSHNFEDFPKKANMLPILLIYPIICKYVFLEHCYNVKNALPDVI